MILEIFGVFTLIGLVLITLGFIKESHSEQALIGFVFLFLLAMEILGGSIQYETGTNSTSYAVYETINATANRTIVYSNEANNYVTFNDSLSHRLGYYLAIASVIGFIGVLISLKRGMKEP